MFLEFLKACTPHLGWLSAELRCTPWILVKRLTLFFDRVFDTAEDFRLPTAASVLVNSLGRLKREDRRGLLHVTTSPTPRASKVNPDILMNGLGPVGSHVIPQYIRDRTVPHEFYGGRVEEFRCRDPMGGFTGFLQTGRFLVGFG